MSKPVGWLCTDCASPEKVDGVMAVLRADLDKCVRARAQARDLVRTAHYHVQEGYRQHDDPVARIWLDQSVEWLANNAEVKR